MDISVYDKDFNPVAVIDSYKSFIWTDRYDKPGDFEIYTVASTELQEILQKDYYIQISDSEHTMIIEDFIVETNVEDGNFIKIVGRSLESILDRRIVWKMTDIDGLLTTGIYRLLNDAIINPEIADRKISNFIIEDTVDPLITSLTMDHQYTGDTILDIVQDMCETNNIGFKITLNENNQFVFKLYAGADRSYAQDTNNYVIFMPSFDNVINTTYQETNSGYKNVTLVAGEDRQYAVQFGAVFDGIIKDGIYETYKKAMIVKASSVDNQVIIQPGRAWFNHTWSYNDADLPFSAPAPETLNGRIDALVLDINLNINQRKNSYQWVKGTPAANPSKPSLINNSVDHFQYPLCYVRRYGGQNKINAADIENAVGTSKCPFVIGVIEGLSIDDLLTQWTAQFNAYVANKQARLDELEQEFFEWMEQQKAAYATFLAHNTTAWTNWFSHLQYELDGDVAGHLQNQIDALGYMYVDGTVLYLPSAGARVSGTKLVLISSYRT